MTNTKLSVHYILECRRCSSQYSSQNKAACDHNELTPVLQIISHFMQALQHKTAQRSYPRVALYTAQAVMAGTSRVTIPVFLKWSLSIKLKAIKC